MVTVAKPQRITAILKRLAFAVTCSFLFSQAWLKFTTNLQRPPRGRPSQFAIRLRTRFLHAGRRAGADPVRFAPLLPHAARTLDGAPGLRACRRPEHHRHLRRALTSAPNETWEAFPNS
ncbi:hypothetical protein MRX96_038025 [Rhipicephalus microplus]